MIPSFLFKRTIWILFCTISAVLLCISLYILVNLEVSYKYEIEEVIGTRGSITDNYFQGMKNYMDMAICLCKTLLGYIVFAMSCFLIEKGKKTAPQ